MHSGVEQGVRNLVMERRGNGHAYGIDAAENAAIIEGRLGAELGSDRAGALLVGVDHGDKLGARIARIMIGMKAPEIASPHDGDANLVCHSPYLTPTRRRPLL